MSDQHQIIFIPSGLRQKAASGESLLIIAQNAGIGVRSLCGGNGLCHQCWVEIVSGKHQKFGIECSANSVSEITALEKQLITENPSYKGKRLSCQTRVKGDLVIDVPEQSQEHKAYISKKNVKQSFNIKPCIRLFDVTLDEATLDNNQSSANNLLTQLDKQNISATLDFELLTSLQSLVAENKGKLTVALRDNSVVVALYPQYKYQVIGAAIDLGSTTIALYVYDLKTGNLIFEGSAMNPQIRFGEDLMSRVSYVMMNKNGDAKLTQAVRHKIAEMLKDACTSLLLDVDKLLEVVLVGNPIMHHLFFGISPVELGQAPFTPATREWIDVSAKVLGLDIYANTRVSFLPLIAGHVGADTVAMYLSQMDSIQKQTTLLVDIGTNAEIVLVSSDKVYATSSPTGPAFEGAEISSGVRATHGAIERVRIDSSSLAISYKLIGVDTWFYKADNKIKAIGICGSGIIEAIVELAKAGVIDKSGLFVETRAPQQFSTRGNMKRFLLIEQGDSSIYIEQGDIRSIQLAKAALSAGVSLLMDYLNCDYFDKVLLAGAFGAHLDAEYVAMLDIIPKASKDIIKSIGNAAGIGASMALLDYSNRAKIINATKKIVKIESASEPKFQQYFVEAMQFSVSPVSAQTSNKSRRRRRVK